MPGKNFMRPFTLILPVYNEEEIMRANTEKLLDYLPSLNTDYEILIVSNGSTDSGDRIGAELDEKYAQVRFFSIPRKGVGRAFKKGISEAVYEHIVFMDADLSSDLVFIKESAQLLDQYVLILGAKIKGLQNRGFMRKMGSFVFFMSVFMLMGLKYVDYAPGAKAYRKNFLMRYFKYIDDHTSFVLNLTFVASVKKEKIIEIPILCEDRRKSRFNLYQEAISKFGGLFTLKIKQMFGRL